MADPGAAVLAPGDVQDIDNSEAFAFLDDLAQTGSLTASQYVAYQAVAAAYVGVQGMRCVLTPFWFAVVAQGGFVQEQVCAAARNASQLVREGLYHA